ncbi:MAG: hypothetical protein ACRD2L_04360, partial [Terriglobia bacterium]
MQFLVEAVGSGSYNTLDVKSQISSYFRDHYLKPQTGITFLTLSSITQFEADCDAAFVPDLITSFVDQGLVEQVSVVKGTAFRFDAGLARWCLEAFDRFGLDPEPPGARDAFVQTALVRYLSGWFMGSWDLIEQIGDENPSLARNLLAVPAVFQKLTSSIATCPAPTFVQLLRYLAPAAKTQLSTLKEAPSPHLFLQLATGYDFANAAYQLSQTDQEQDLIGSLATPMLVKKLQDSMDLRVYSMVFAALKHSPHLLATVAESVDYTTALRNLPTLLSFVNCVATLQVHKCEKRLLEAARGYPIKKLALLARASKLRVTGWAFEYLSRDENWDADQFAELCGSLTA